MTYTIIVSHKDVTNEVIKLNNAGYTIVSSQVKENKMLEIIYRWRSDSNIYTGIPKERLYSVSNAKKHQNHRKSYINSCEKQIKHI